jgi:hypothetical protein
MPLQIDARGGEVAGAGRAAVANVPVARLQMLVEIALGAGAKSAKGTTMILPY